MLQSIYLVSSCIYFGKQSGASHRAVEAVDPNLSVSLEGFDDCNVCQNIFPCDSALLMGVFQTFDTHTTAFYNSSEFQQMATQSAPFLNSLPPYLDGRSVELQNMVCKRASCISSVF
jgi:prostatic aicd phosphatase